MKSRIISRSLLVIIAFGIFFAGIIFIDTTPDANSYRTAYNGVPTTVLQERKAHLSNSTENIFWFIHITDVHIGAYWIMGNNRQNFRDFLRNTKQILNESYGSFIVDTGDLTNGMLPAPIRQDVRQWRDRYNILMDARMFNTSFYYDLPGNHDGYSDSDTFSYFLNWSVQKTLQYSWSRTFPFGNYTFIALNSVDDKGASWPYGTAGSLNQTELDWFEQQLIAAQSSNLTFVFSHHPENDMGNSTTSVTNKTFLELIEEYKVAAHIYGHGHENHERNQGGTICIESDSLGLPSDTSGYRIFTVDNDGISTKFQPLNSWPAVIITCPIDRELTMQAFDIPNNSKAVPIRALVFDESQVTNVQFKIDEGTWMPMNRDPKNPYLWTGFFDASNLTNAEHLIMVRATSPSGSDTDTIQIRVGSYDRPEIINGPLPNFLRTKNCPPWILNLSMYEWDEHDKGIQLNWSVSNVNPSLCDVEVTDIVNDIVTFTPVPDATGTANVTITLTNSAGKQISQYIIITLVDRLDQTTLQRILIITLIICVVGVGLFNFMISKKLRSPQSSLK